MHANAGRRLLQHYVDNCRMLPWRSPPGQAPPDPYRVWLSEVMLQQTTVAAVAPRFERFVERWPTVEALAAASDEEILGEWAGLGYYARARNLIACARQVAAAGAFPDSEEGLRALPGVGDYTAAAIAAIAFGADSVAVDTNVERVAARLHGIEQPARDKIKLQVRAMTPAGRSGDLAQAMMDLGATICRARNPICGRCPVRWDCSAFASGEPERFPARKVKRAKPVRFGIAHWLERDGALLLVRRPSKGLLGGMAALPGCDWVGNDSDPRDAVAKVRHVFTHFELRLSIVPVSSCDEPGWWQPLDTIEQAGLPTLYRKAVQAVLDRRQPLAA